MLQHRGRRAPRHPTVLLPSVYTCPLVSTQCPYEGWLLMDMQQQQQLSSNCTAFGRPSQDHNRASNQGICGNFEMNFDEADSRKDALCARGWLSLARTKCLPSCTS